MHIASRTNLVLGCIGCSVYFLVLALQYHETARLVREYLTAPECNEAASTTPTPRTAPLCTYENQRIVKLSRSGRRSSSYYAVLQDRDDAESKVRLESLNSKSDAGMFWDSAWYAEVVEVQKFRGKIVFLFGYSINVATTNHPQCQLSNLKTGMAITGGGAILFFAIIWYLRRTPSA